jgi:hypothetical protein
MMPARVLPGVRHPAAIVLRSAHICRQSSGTPPGLPHSSTLVGVLARSPVGNISELILLLLKLHHRVQAERNDEGQHSDHNDPQGLLSVSLAGDALIGRLAHGSPLRTVPDVPPVRRQSAGWWRARVRVIRVHSQRMSSLGLPRSRNEKLEQVSSREMWEKRRLN